MARILIVLALLCLPALARAQTTTLPDATWWSQGSWLAYAAPWGKGELVAGRDFADTITVVPETFPARTVIRWQWPLTDGTVRGYNHVAYGNYNGGAVRTPVESVRIADARTMTYDFDITVNPSIGEFNVMHEDFLQKPDGTKAIEVAWMHQVGGSALQWIKRYPRLTDHVDRYGRTWTAYLTPSGPSYPDIKFAIFVPESDVLVGRIDKLAGYRSLIRDGAMRGDEVWTGTATGVEPISGSGSILINSLSVTVH